MYVPKNNNKRMDPQNMSKVVELCPVNNSTDDDDDIVETIKPVVTICFSLIGIMGFIGNTLVIYVVLPNPQMRSTTNLLIINLAIADLLVCISFCSACCSVAAVSIGMCALCNRNSIFLFIENPVHHILCTIYGHRLYVGRLATWKCLV